MPDHDETETFQPVPFVHGWERLPAGEVVGGRYEILSLLGVGGYAVVYRVFDQELRREIALKVLRKDRYTPSALTRLRRELKVARDTASRHLVRIFDIGTAPEGTYLTMELLSGESLKEHLARGQLPIERAIDVAAQVLEGLAALHRCKIIHRDVKPGNVLFGEDGEVRLADFGLARQLENDETRATLPEGVVGTRAYLAPELILGEEAGPWSDLYAAGIVFYEMLTGELPHKGESDLGTMLGRFQPGPDPRDVRPEVPRWLAACVRRLLSRRPSDRYPTAEAVLSDLQAKRRPGIAPSARKRLLRFAVLLLVLSGAAFGVLALAPWRDDSRFSHVGAVGEDGIRGVGKEGEVLWQLEGVEPEARYQAKLARTRPGRHTRLALVAYPPLRTRSKTVRTLSFLAPETGRVVKEVALPDGARHFPEFSDRFRPDVLSVLDINRDGVDEIVITYIHTPEWPSFTVLYEPKIDRAREVFHGSGHHRIAGVEDLDENGRPELLFVGINNRLGWYNVLAAVRLDPWISEEPSVRHETTASPDDAATEGEVGGLYFYALLPRGMLAPADRALVFDRENRTITVRYMNGREEILGFGGFPLAEPSSLSAAARQAARHDAFYYLREAGRLAAGGEEEAGLVAIETALEKARKAGDSRLIECLTRAKGRQLVSASRESEGQELFRALVETSENASEIAFDAGEALHLAGNLLAAAEWYRRGMGSGGSPESGKSKHGFIEGEVLALVEAGRYEEAAAAVERFALTYPDHREAANYREFVRWRRGELPDLDRLWVRPTSVALHRYWQLELEYARGLDPRGLLREVEEELSGRSDLDAELLSLKAELLRELGDREEAINSAVRALEIARREARRSTVTRAHLDLVEQRARMISEKTDL